VILIILIHYELDPSKSDKASLISTALVV